MHPKKHLQFNALRQCLSKHFLSINDLRQQSKLDYQLHDCLMSGFAMMFFQDPSILESQRRLEEQSQFSNLSSVFQIKSVPKESQMRDTLDWVDSQHLFPIFSDWLHLSGRYIRIDPILRCFIFYNDDLNKPALFFLLSDIIKKPAMNRPYTYVDNNTSKYIDESGLGIIGAIKCIYL